MAKSKYVFIVSMNVKKEYEELFNEVYDKEHIPFLLEVTGVNRVSRARGVPFSFSIGGKSKKMDVPNQKFVALYELDSPDVVNSHEWSVAVEKGRWSTHVRQFTYDRSHFMYRYH